MHQNDATLADELRQIIDAYYRAYGRGFLLCTDSQPPSYVPLEDLETIPFGEAIGEENRRVLADLVQRYNPPWEAVVVLVFEDGSVEWKRLNLGKKTTISA